MIRTIEASRTLCAALAAAVVAAACTPFPTWHHRAVTRAATRDASAVLTPEQIGRGREVAAGVAETARLVADDGTDEQRDIHAQMSAWHTPPRHFLSAYKGEVSYGQRISFTVELDGDGRALYFTVYDPNRGEPTDVVAKLDALVQARVASAFAELAVAHEAEELGPFFDLPP